MASLFVYTLAEGGVFMFIAGIMIGASAGFLIACLMKTAAKSK